jgi:hypothetical protein
MSTPGAGRILSPGAVSGPGVRGPVQPICDQNPVQPARNQVQWQVIDTQAGAARVNLLLTFSPAISVLYYTMGYTGTPVVFVSIDPVSQSIESGGVLTPNGGEQWWLMEPIAANNAPNPNVNINKFRIKFCQPVIQLYVSHADYGVGGFLVFAGTDDVEYGIGG